MSLAASIARPLALPVLEDLPDPAGARVLLRATLDLPLSSDPSSALALLRARGLAATVKWLVERAATVTVWGAPCPGASPPHVRSVLDALEPSLRGSRALHLRTSEEDDRAVAKAASSHDLFVNDSLQDSLLPLPSVVMPPSQLPSAIGRTFQEDLTVLEPLVTGPDRPFVAVLGGARTLSRLHNLQGLVLRADAVLLGGGLALPMLRALGREPAEVDGDEEFLWECREVLGLSQRVRHRLVVPDDLVWSRDDNGDGRGHVASRRTRSGDRVVDIGPRARLRFGEELRGARSVLWAGSVGRVEDEPFRAGTRALAHALGDALGQMTTVVLGGDALVGLLEREDLVPPGARALTATDAAIELLENGDLPALAVLRHRRAAPISSTRTGRTRAPRSPGPPPALRAP